MPVDLSEVCLDTDLGECFEILRTTGQFAAGGWQETMSVAVQAFGIITIAESEALDQIPEGDRVTGALQVITADPIYETLARNSGVSDKIRYFGNLYRVQAVAPWRKSGFFSAVLTRMTGE